MFTGILLKLAPLDRLPVLHSSRRGYYQFVAEYYLEVAAVLTDEIILGIRNQFRRSFLVTLSKNSFGLWRKLGVFLRELRIADCRIPAELLYKILRDCPMLRVLKFDLDFRLDNS